MKETLTKCDQCSKVFDPEENGSVQIYPNPFHHGYGIGEDEHRKKELRRLNNSHVKGQVTVLDERRRKVGTETHDIILTGEYCSVQCLIAKLISAPAKLSTLQ